MFSRRRSKGSDQGRRTGEDPIRGFITLGDSPAAVTLLRQLEELAAEATDPSDAPMPTDAQSVGVAKRAVELAREGREDQAAVAELRELAGATEDLLLRAERLTRQGAMHSEDRTFNRAHRLLAAAMTGQPVKPVTPSDEGLFDTLAGFFGRPSSAKHVWADLVVREPELAEVEAEVRAGRFGPGLEEEDSAAEVPRDEEWARVHGEYLLLELALAERLDRILGPGSASSEAIGKSWTARAFAAQYLGRLPRETGRDEGRNRQS
jgi:hypothetical protein